MCLLFETIRIVDGEPENLELHEKRLNHSRQKMYGSRDSLILSDFINVPEEFKRGIVKCRVIYGSSFRSAEYEHYVTAPVKTLKLVNGNRIVYDMKYLDRSGLIKLVNRKIADDILIIKRNCVTDTSYSNIVFTDGRKWFTPDIPLLRGTMREKLLSQGVIHEERITVDKIGSFTHFRLINAMLGFNHSVQPVKNIF